MEKNSDSFTIKEKMATEPHVGTRFDIGVKVLLKSNIMKDIGYIRATELIQENTGVKKKYQITWENNERIDEKLYEPKQLKLYKPQEGGSTSSNKGKEYYGFCHMLKKPSSSGSEEGNPPVVHIPIDNHYPQNTMALPEDDDDEEIDHDKELENDNLIDSHQW